MCFAACHERSIIKEVDCPSRLGAVGAVGEYFLLHSRQHGTFGGCSALSKDGPQVVNGPSHPGAVGAPPAKLTPPPPAVPGGSHAAPLSGWRDLLVAEGPAAWAKAVRQHPGVLLTDTTWRAPTG